MDISLFADLSEAHSDAVISLNYQYRMNTDIMSLTNELVYKNQMKCGSDEVAAAKLLLSNYCVYSHELEKGNYFVDVSSLTYSARGSNFDKQVNVCCSNSTIETVYQYANVATI